MENNTALKKYEVIDALPDREKVNNSFGSISMFQQAVRERLVEGIDYGKAYYNADKPSLLKSGAEKIIMLLGLRSRVYLDEKIENWQKGFFYYRFKYQLLKNDEIIQEGYGACNSKEKKYIKQDSFSIQNTVLKMAKKRAMVDAVLVVASLSNIFTQDIEDFEDYQNYHQYNNNNNNNGKNKQNYNKQPAQKQQATQSDNKKIFGALKSVLMEHPDVSENLINKLLEKDRDFEKYLYRKIKFDKRKENECWKIVYTIKNKEEGDSIIIETIEQLYNEYEYDKEEKELHNE